VKIKILKSPGLPPGRHNEWKNALKPKGRVECPLNISSKGNSEYKILLPSFPDTQEQKAASDLQFWLKEITGIELPIVREGRHYSPAGKEISIGKTNILKGKLPLLYEGKQGEDGYTIAVEGNRLYLAGGNRRGIINAVYALLEEDIGCRWYDEISSSIPRMPDLQLFVVPREYKPPLELREPYIWDAFDGNWSLHNRTYSTEAKVPDEWGGYLSYPGETFRERDLSTHQDTWFVHTFHHLLSPEDFFLQHPEYFSEINGVRKPLQLCLTNPVVFDIALNKIRNILRKYPCTKIISISPNDTDVHCECSLCQAVNQKEGTKMATLLQFVNRIAVIINKEFPGVRISTLAYQQTIMPPKTIIPEKNVVIYLCTDRHAWGWPFLPVNETPTVKKALKLWKDKGANIYIWDYVVNYSHLPLPMPNLSVITRNMRYYLKYSVNGIMLQGAFQSYGSDNAPLRCWVWAKQLWNPGWNIKSLVYDFVYGYYGQSAPYLWEYNRSLLDMWETYYKKGCFKDGAVYHIRYTPDSPFLSKRFMERSFELFSEAETKAESSEILRRVKLAKLPILYTLLSQDLGVVTLPPRFWTGKNNMLKQVISGKKYNFSRYKKYVDEIRDIVQKEKITTFTEGYFDKRIPEGTTQAQVCIDTWSSLTEGIPDMDILRLNDIWEFCIDPENKGVIERWYKKRESDRYKWLEILTNIDPGPGHQGWESVKGFENYQGYAWYRQRFWFPSMFDRRSYLQMVFLVVKREADIWINGEKVYEHTCASTGLDPDEIGVNEMPIFFDCRKFLKMDSQNIVAVRVKGWKSYKDNRCGICKPVVFLSTERKMSAYMVTILTQLFLNIKRRR